MTNPPIIILPSGPRRISVVRRRPSVRKSERFFAAFDGSSFETLPKIFIHNLVGKKKLN